MWEGESECLHLLILRVCEGMGDLLLAPSVCLEGHRHSLILLSLCVRVGDREPTQINIMCVYVREGETKCLICVWGER